MENKIKQQHMNPKETLVGLVRDKFQQAETSRSDEKRWLKYTETIEDYGQKWHFVKTKSQEYLLR